MYRKNSHDEYIAYFICRKKTGAYKVWDPPPHTHLKQNMTGFKIKLHNVLCQNLYHLLHSVAELIKVWMGLYFILKVLLL